MHNSIGRDVPVYTKDFVRILMIDQTADAMARINEMKELDNGTILIWINWCYHKKEAKGFKRSQWPNNSWNNPFYLLSSHQAVLTANSIKDVVTRPENLVSGEYAFIVSTRSRFRGQVRGRLVEFSVVNENRVPRASRMSAPSMY